MSTERARGDKASYYYRIHIYDDYLVLIIEPISALAPLSVSVDIHVCLYDSVSFCVFFARAVANACVSANVCWAES